MLRPYRLGLATLAACAVITGALPASVASAGPFQDQWAWQHPAELHRARRHSASWASAFFAATANKPRHDL